jgi:hypothetical protein
MATSVTNPEQARQDLAEILSGGRVEISEAQARMAERGHPPGRIDRARRALEVDTVRQGRPGVTQQFFWRLPTSCPTCLRPFGPGGVSASAPWNGYQAGDADGWRDDASHIEPPHDPPEVQFPPSQPAPLPRSGPPRCSLCGKASAVDPGSPCPYFTTAGQRCRGVVQ